MAVITFCSNEIKETGQTLSMAAIASYMAIEHNYKILMISTGFNGAFLPLWNSINNSGELLSIETLLSPSLSNPSSFVPPFCSDGTSGLSLPSTAILFSLISKTVTK